MLRYCLAHTDTFPQCNYKLFLCFSRIINTYSKLSARHRLISGRWVFYIPTRLYVGRFLSCVVCTLAILLVIDVNYEEYMRGSLQNPIHIGATCIAKDGRIRARMLLIDVFRMSRVSMCYMWGLLFFRLLPMRSGRKSSSRSKLCLIHSTSCFCNASGCRWLI